jgi:hypothetical protein
MIEVFDFPQNSPEWFQCRLGIPTASRFKDVMAKGKGISRANYLFDLAGEIVTGKPADHYTNAAMERGHELEEEARHLYAMITDTEPVRVGFIRNGRIGASPDYLVAEEGIVEIKTRLPRLQIELLLDDEVPNAHKAQIQGQLMITNREWVDFMSYCPGMKPFLKRIHRDVDYMVDLDKELQDFIVDLDRTVARVRG